MVFRLLKEVMGMVERSYSFNKAREEFDLKLANTLKIRANAGHMVQSQGEKLIANKLYKCEIPYIYNRELKVNGSLIRPDFLLPENNGLIIEFKGMDSDEYNEKFKRKIDILEAAGINCLVLRPGDLQKLDRFIA